MPIADVFFKNKSDLSIPNGMLTHTCTYEHTTHTHQFIHLLPLRNTHTHTLLHTHTIPQTKQTPTLSDTSRRGDRPARPHTPWPGPEAQSPSWGRRPQPQRCGSCGRGWFPWPDWSAAPACRRPHLLSPATPVTPGRPDVCGHDQRGWIAQLAECCIEKPGTKQPGTMLMQVWTPPPQVWQGIFLPVSFQCRFSHRVYIAPVCNHTHQHLYTL